MIQFEFQFGDCALNEVVTEEGFCSPCLYGEALLDLHPDENSTCKACDLERMKCEGDGSVGV